MPRPIWLFDLDNTLHDASHAAFRHLNEEMTAYIVRELGRTPAEADAMRRDYWLRYGATVLGLIRHHGVKSAHFMHHTHLLPGLEERLRGHAHDFHALRRLPGRRLILTNAPADYTARVLGVLGIARWFQQIVTIEDMHMFGQLRPKPDTRMLRRLATRLRVHPSQCVLVEDTPGHLKAARSLGMATVWMWRYRPGLRAVAGVDRRVGALRQLLR